MSVQGGHSGVETIFWDIGGVLLTNGWDETQRRDVLTRIGADVAAYERVHEEANFFWERGLMTARAFFERTVFATSPGLTLGFEELWAMVCAESRVLHPGSFDLLDRLNADGRYRLATLNNESRELNAHRMDAFDLRRRFSYFVCSGYVHEMKPAAGIYEDAIAISGRDASTALFLDDKAENCAAARAAGMRAIRFETPGKLCDELAGLGILNA